VLRVGERSSPLSLGGQVVPVERLRGPLPASGAVALVETDEDCQPDARGVSHCTNRMRLPDEPATRELRSHLRNPRTKTTA
jgi:hypothetical protein